MRAKRAALYRNILQRTGEFFSRPDLRRSKTRLEGFIEVGKSLQHCDVYGAKLNAD